ncbi:MAG: putative collagen-binding domain-containing protein, partial [Candidatus Hodarchaeota archaeon]
MEAWGFEYPFNQRDVFVPEYEELWMRYLVARYDAFSSIYIWTLMNEYEYYPDGDWRYNPIADLWAIRTGRYVKSIASHGHPIAVHNGPSMPPFVKRFRMAPGVIDLIMFQSWGSTRKHDSWLAAGIEDSIASSMKDWTGAFILAEYGYERNPSLELKFPPHEHIDVEHTRRGAWRGAFSATGVIHGWENTWGPWWIPEEDQEGMKYLLILKKFFTENVTFHRFRPDSTLLDHVKKYDEGKKPLCMTTREKDQLILYLPVGDDLYLKTSSLAGIDSYWFNPRTGKISQALGKAKVQTLVFEAPDDDDWVLVLTRTR